MDTVVLTSSRPLASEKDLEKQGETAASTFWGIAAAVALISLFTANGITTSVAIMILPILGLLLWRRGEPPVLLFGCVFQWLQATAAIFYTNYYGITLNDAFGSYELSLATWLSMAAVLSLAFGIRAAFLHAGPPQGEAIRAEAKTLNIRRVAVIYFIAMIISTVLNSVAWRFASATQPILALASLKWAFVYILCYTVLSQQRGYGVLAVCVVLEFALGLFGMFSQFKSVFFVLVVAALSSPNALKGRRLLATVVSFVLLAIMGVVWTSVKMDYRAYLAEEASGPDDSTAPLEQRVNKLTDLVASLTWDNINDGLDAMVMRVSYVNLFALTIENVPNRIPFENGDLWKGAAIHVLTPRILFPDKPGTDDSERTRLYTGLNVAGSEAGTSIGIGYVGESYVDFGPTGMFIPIVLLGVMYGIISRCLIAKARYKLLGSSFAVSILIFSAYAIETSNIKLLGGVMAAALVAAVVYKAMGRVIMEELRSHAAPTEPAWAKATFTRLGGG